MAMPLQPTGATPDGMADPRVGSAAPVDETEKSRQTVELLEGYRLEATTNRKGGLNPRDDKWRENLNLYWNRWDFSAKASWQAKETMPEVPSFVDRFSAALKEALVAVPEGFYTVVDPADENRDLADAVKRMNDVWLSRSGRNAHGTLLGFPSIFEEQMKLGALTMLASTVTWKEDVPGGRVAIETVDPQFVWLDHTGRNLYRIRRTEIDRHEIIKMAKAEDRTGKPIWNLEQLKALTTYISAEDEGKRQDATGVGTQVISTRVPIVLDEYIATVVDRQGNMVGEENSLYVVANERFLVRGPERNPFVHGADWLVTTPLVTVPMSPYGRSYMEDFGSVAKTFTELTNMILDAVHTSSLNAYAIVPSMLADPRQASEGITPNKLFKLEDGVDARMFAQKLELGNLSPDAVRVWESMKRELTEAAGINEIGLGQFAPKGRTSATEIDATQQSSSALIRSIAQTIEGRWLEPTLDLTWKTGIQHMRPTDPVLRDAAGWELFNALVAQRRELIKRPFTFQARGISTLIQKGQMLNKLLQILQVISSNEALLTAFMQQVDVGRLVQYILTLGNIDVTRMQMTDRQKLIATITQPLMQAQNAAQAKPENPMAQRATQTPGLSRA